MLVSLPDLSAIFEQDFEYLTHVFRRIIAFGWVFVSFCNGFNTFKQQTKSQNQYLYCRYFIHSRIAAFCKCTRNFRFYHKSLQSTQDQVIPRIFYRPGLLLVFPKIDFDKTQHQNRVTSFYLTNGDFDY